MTATATASSAFRVSSMPSRGAVSAAISVVIPRSAELVLK